MGYPVGGLMAALGGLYVTAGLLVWFRLEPRPPSRQIIALGMRGFAYLMIGAWLVIEQAAGYEWFLRPMALAGAVVIGASLFVAFPVFRGVRNIPAAVRRIGKPDAWRGE